MTRRAGASGSMTPMRPTLAALTLLCTALLSAGFARADDAAMSRFHYEEASKHYERGRYGQAIEQFFLAQRLSPSSRTLYNIGLCFTQLEQPRQAHQFFQEYLDADDSGEGAAERRAFATETIERLRGELALLRVESSPPGARLYVDREELGSYGETPRTIALDPGEHRVWVELEGHRPAEATVEVSSGHERTLELSPEPIVGRLLLSSNAEGATATLVDGEGRSRTVESLPAELTLPPGRYDVEVRGEGRQPWTGIAGVEADGETRVEATLEPPTGTLTITANILEAQVSLDGRSVGFTPLPLPELSVGEHEVIVTAPGLMSWDGVIDVNAGEQAWASVSLLPPPEGRSPWAYVTGGLGAAAGLTAIGTGLAAVLKRSDLEDRRDAGVGVDLQSDADRVDRLARTTDYLLGVAAIFLTVGVVVYFTTGDDPDRRSQVVISRSAPSP